MFYFCSFGQEIDHDPQQHLRKNEVDASFWPTALHRQHQHACKRVQVDIGEALWARSKIAWPVEVYYYTYGSERTRPILTIRCRDPRRTPQAIGEPRADIGEVINEELVFYSNEIWRFAIL